MNKHNLDRELYEEFRRNTAPSLKYIAWFYYPEDNYFVDEMGEIVYDMFRYITPNDLALFKLNKEYMCFTNRDGVYVELHHLDEYEY